MKTGAPITQACVLFLDFDGVLHSVPGTTIGHGLNAHQRDQAFAHLARLETLLQEPQYEEVMICVSSSWKDVYPWEDILGFFSEDMQKRVIGRTPDLGGSTAFGDSPRSMHGSKRTRSLRAGSRWMMPQTRFPSGWKSRVMRSSPTRGWAWAMKRRFRACARRWICSWRKQSETDD